MLAEFRNRTFEMLRLAALHLSGLGLWNTDELADMSTFSPHRLR